MKKIFCLQLLLFTVSLLQAQYKVQFILKEQTAIKHDSIYISGNFNNWDASSNKKYLMKPIGRNKKSITLTVGKGLAEYKFHRGNWQKGEKHSDFGEVANREVYISRDTVLTDSVQGWRDEIIEDQKVALTKGPNDSLAINLLTNIGMIYAFTPEYYNGDSALYYAQKALNLVQNTAAANTADSPASINRLFLLNGIVAKSMRSLGNYPKALEIRLENVELAEKAQNASMLASALIMLTYEYIAMEDYQSALQYYKRVEHILPSIGDEDPQKEEFTGRFLRGMAESYFNLGQLDSALIFAKAWEQAVNIHNYPAPRARYNLLLGDIYWKMGDLEAALKQYKNNLGNDQNGLGLYVAQSKVGIAKVNQAQKKYDIALNYALEALHFYQNNPQEVSGRGENTDTYIAQVSPLIAALYMHLGKPDSGYYFLQRSIALKDSLYNADRIRQFQILTFNETARRQQLEQQKKDARQQFETRMKIYGLIAGLLVALFFTIILIRNNKHKQRANNLLKTQKKRLEQTLDELKNTQAQLIQSEKLASLGELTAGIAHEIQNPLNFVNNFSTLSVGLVGELNEEIGNLNIEEKDRDYIREILDDLTQNQQKINHHGKRAAAIVTGMLQHARTSTGQKVPTDLNALADEYLRLAYHGLRAKDATFNAKMETDLDPNIGMVEVVPQDIGRVFLNLINNAFYATQQRAGASDGVTSSHPVTSPYEPTVSFSSKKENGQVVFRIKDNGTGIPDEVKAKIFQPFFTTKPTGEGTGLGLSLAYDIVVKGHGGTLEVETKEGEGTAFIISLPAKTNGQ